MPALPATGPGLSSSEYSDSQEPDPCAPDRHLPEMKHPKTSGAGSQ